MYHPCLLLISMLFASSQADPDPDTILHLHLPPEDGGLPGRSCYRCASSTSSYNRKSSQDWSRSIEPKKGCFRATGGWTHARDSDNRSIDKWNGQRKSRDYPPNKLWRTHVISRVLWVPKRSSKRPVPFNFSQNVLNNLKRGCVINQVQLKEKIKDPCDFATHQGSLLFP